MLLTAEDIKSITNGSGNIIFVGKFSTMEEAKKKCKESSYNSVLYNPVMFTLDDNKDYIYFSDDRIEEYSIDSPYTLDTLKELELINNMITYNYRKYFDTEELKNILDNMMEFLKLRNLSDYIVIDFKDGKPQFIVKGENK